MNSFLKNLFFLILILILLNIFAVQIFSAEMTVYYDYTHADFQPMNLLIDDEEFTYSVPVTPLFGVSYVPVQAVFEALGATVRWKGDEDKVIVEKDGISIVFTINKNEAVVNGNIKDMGTAPKVVRYAGQTGFYTIVPTRFTAEELGFYVGYDNTSRTVIINTTAFETEPEPTEEVKPTNTPAATPVPTKTPLPTEIPVIESSTPTPTKIPISTPSPTQKPTPTPTLKPTPIPSDSYEIKKAILKYARSEKMGVVIIDGIEITEEMLAIGLYKENYIDNSCLEITYSKDYLQIDEGLSLKDDSFIKEILIRDNQVENTQTISIQFNTDLSYGNITKEGTGKTTYYFREPSGLASRGEEIEYNGNITYSTEENFEEILVGINNLTGYSFIGTAEENKRVISFKNTDALINPEEFIVNTKRINSIKYARHDSDSIWFVIDIRDDYETEILKYGAYYKIIIKDKEDTPEPSYEPAPVLTPVPTPIITGRERYNHEIAKNLFYSNINDRIYLKIDGAVLTSGGEEHIKYYTEKYENSSRKYIMEFPSHLAELDTCKIIINDRYLESIEIVKISSTRRTKIIFTAYDRFIYCVFTRNSSKLNRTETAISILKPNIGSQKLIVIDPGHGNWDPGAVVSGIYEKNINLAIAQKIKNELAEHNINVYITREDDDFLDLYERAYIANYLNASAFICLHNNASIRSAVHGTETFYYPSITSATGLTGKKMAEIIQNQLVGDLGSFYRYIKSNNNFVVLKATMMPAVLTEIGYMTNPEELSKLLSQSYQDKIAKSLIRAIEQIINSMD